MAKIQILTVIIALSLDYPSDKPFVPCTKIDNLKSAMRNLKYELNKVKTLQDEPRLSAAAINEFLASVKTCGTKGTDKILISEASKKYSKPLNRYQFYLISAMGYHKTEYVYEFLETLLAKDDPILHIAASNAYATNPTSKDIEYLFKILEKEKYTWEAKVEAVSGLTKLINYIRENQSLQLRLASLMDTATMRRRIKSSINEILQEITGLRNDNHDPIFWKSKLLNVEAKQETGIAVPSPKLLGIKLQSDRLVLVLDYSLSMRANTIEESLFKNDDDLSRKQLRNHQDKILTGLDKKDTLCKGNNISDKDLDALKKCRKIYDEWGARKINTNIELLKRETIKTIYFMDCEIYFNLVLFHAYAEEWQNKLLPCTWENKLSAMEFLINKDLVFGTNMGQGLLDAYSYTEVGSSEGIPTFNKNNKEHPFFLTHGVDSIILFTDGVPYNDIIGSSSLIRDFISKLAISRKIKIDTIGFLKGLAPQTEPEAAEFLKKLSMENYGECKLYQ